MKLNSSKGSLILSAGNGFRGEATGRTLKHDLYVLEKEAGPGENVAITFSAAQIDTSYPGSIDFCVEVVPQHTRSL